MQSRDVYLKGQQIVLLVICTARVGNEEDAASLVGKFYAYVCRKLIRSTTNMKQRVNIVVSLNISEVNARALYVSIKTTLGSLFLCKVVAAG